MEMGEQYGLPDLRHLMGGRTDFPAVAQAPEQLSGHRDLTAQQHYDMMMGGRPVVGEVLPRGVVEFRSDSTTTSSAAALCGLEMEGCIGGDGGNGRWPRQETLTLLEIRSRLDPKFKEANQKGPLWDEISRIMADEHGYQRSGKKCREKFENLYKYYKKTKEGKAGRQDGKHYRFFRQLEALYGEPSNLMSVSQTHFTGNSLLFQSTNNTSQANQEAPQAHQKLCESLSLSSSSEFDTSSSEKDSAEMMKLKMKDSQSFKRGRKSWKAKIRDFVDSQMKKLMEIQETWLQKMLKTLEQKEQERMSREEEWKKQEAARLDREQKFWANERAWVEARDAALMEALQKFSGREVKASSSEELMATDLHENSETHIENESETLESTMNNSNRWLDPEISSLVNLRTNMESRFQKCGGSEGVLWEEISAKMVCLGYNQRAKSCKDKWETINNWIRNSKGCNKKRKENSRSCTYFQHLDSPYNQRRAYCGHEIDEQGPEKVGSHSNDAPSPSNSNAGTTVQESCFRYLMGEGGSMWENYGFELNKGENQ